MLRTRFAPSPTGFLHVGGLRTALYNYLLARKNKGKFILRIEDTDRSRFIEGAVESLIKTLKWIGLEYDEGPAIENNELTDKDIGEFGPYIQSRRLELYRKHAELLLEKGAAYHCFCNPERLEEMRKKQAQHKLAPMYDRLCLNLPPKEIQARIKKKLPHVIRQKMPHERDIRFKDVIRGHLTFKGSTIDDQILLKSDGWPTYHLANVVDDFFMQITHVIRGEEWLPSTPKHLMLYEAFGWNPPEFAHIPLTLNADKTKLSKRQNDVSVEEYIEKGYSKEAIINFIVFLGWPPGKGEEKEIFSLEELIEHFSLEQIHKSGAVFDIEKLKWFNFQWNKSNYHEKLNTAAKEIDTKSEAILAPKNEKIFQFSSPEKEKIFLEVRGEILFETVKNHIPAAWLEHKGSLLEKALITIEEKILKNPSEAALHLKFYFEMGKPLNLELLCNPKMQVDRDIAKTALTEAKNHLQKWEKFGSSEEIKTCLLDVVTKLGLKNGQVLWPVRVALTNEQFTPGVFEVIWALGKEETLKRLEEALK